MGISGIGDRRRPKPRAHRVLLLGLTVFAVAMAYLEAALVVYLRQLLYPENVRQIFPMRLITPSLLAIELGRETATMAMLASVAMVVQTTLVRRVAVFVYVFGLWDVFYYLWLKVTIGWPVSWLDWDVLFLIPWVWLGPWVCPALIAVLYSAWAARVLASPSELRFGKARAGAFVVGALLCLASFLEPALSVLLETGVGGLEGYVPDGFWWVPYSVGWVMMALGLPWARPSLDRP